MSRVLLILGVVLLLPVTPVSESADPPGGDPAAGMMFDDVETSRKPASDEDEGGDEVQWGPDGEPACLINRKALNDVKRRQKQLDEKEKELDQRLSEVEGREKVLAEEFTKLEAIRKEILAIDAENIAKREEKVSKLVETFESMSPKKVAAVLSTVSEDMAVDAMFRIETARLAKIMNAMNPKKSAELSQLMATGRRLKTKPKPVDRQQKS